MTGMRLPISLDLISRVASRPLISGIRWSTKIRSGIKSFITSIRTLVLHKTNTLYPLLVRTSLQIDKWSTSSSTNNIFLVPAIPIFLLVNLWRRSPSKNANRLHEEKLISRLKTLKNHQQSRDNQYRNHWVANSPNVPSPASREAKKGQLSFRLSSIESINFAYGFRNFSMPSSSSC